MAWVRPRCYWITAHYRTIASGRKGGDFEMALISLICFPRKGAANLVAPHAQCWLTAMSLCRAAPLNDRWMICEQRARAAPHTSDIKNNILGDNLRGTYTVQRQTRIGDWSARRVYRAALDKDMSYVTDLRGACAASRTCPTGHRRWSCWSAAQPWRNCKHILYFSDRLSVS